MDGEARLEYATKKRNGINCTFLSNIGLDCNHMVWTIEFADGKRWVARLQMPHLGERASYPASLKAAMECEFRTISNMQQKTKIPFTKSMHLR